MRTFQPRHALLTGAAGAIGAALTRCLAARHPALRFTLVDRDGNGLQVVAEEQGGRARALVWDLARPDKIPELWTAATTGAEPVDLLVNCAGFMEVRSFAATSWELGERLLNVDLVSPLRLMHLAIADMGEAGGAIVNVSSMAGRVPIRGCSFYGAAKAGLAMASELAGLELARRGIHVLTVLPGAVRSALEARARGQLPATRLVRHIPTGQPAVLAQRIERALRHGRKRVVYPDFYRIADALPGLGGRLTAALSPMPTDRE